MKTAKEWLDEEGYGLTNIWSKENVYQVITRFEYLHSQKIISLIDEMIKDSEEHGMQSSKSIGKIHALQELKQKIELL